MKDAEAKNGRKEVLLQHLIREGESIIEEGEAAIREHYADKREEKLKKQ